MGFVPIRITLLSCAVLTLAIATGCPQKSYELGETSTASAENGGGFHGHDGGVVFPGQHLDGGVCSMRTAEDELILQGQLIFRFDTFGDDAFWTGQLGLHQAIEGSDHGGAGKGVSPRTALSVGLKVDAQALPQDVIGGIRTGKISMDDPATTLALLKLGAVVGVQTKMNSDNSIKSLGVTCALCHSTVDDSVAPGIGKRLDGWPNRDLNVGAIVDLSPNLNPIATTLGVDVATVHKVLQSWGPGKYDAELNLDGKAFQPDGRSAATLIPAAFGMAGVNLHTYTGWGSVPYWNGFVAILQMHGVGNFNDSRLDDAAQFPVAARNGFGHVKVGPDQDLVTPKLPALQAYQLSLQAPNPPVGSFDPAAARRGDDLFTGKAGCANCHMEPMHTDTGWNMHTAQEIGIDDFQANRSPQHAYRTTPLNGLWAHTKGGFYHDGRFPTLLDVVNHYDDVFGLGLTASEKNDLVEYMKSLGPAVQAPPPPMD